MNYWVIVLLGVIIEFLNLIYALSQLRDDKPMSTILIVPLFFTVGGLILWLGLAGWPWMLLAVAVHLVLNVMIPWYGGAYRYTLEDRQEWWQNRKKR